MMNLTDRQRQAVEAVRTDGTDECAFDLPPEFDGQWCKVTVEAGQADEMQAVVTVEPLE